MSGYRFIPVDTGERASNRTQRPSVIRPIVGRAIGATIMVCAVIAFIAFILHGGVFLLVPAVIVWRLITAARNGARRSRIRHAQRTAQVMGAREPGQWSPRNPYDHI